MVLGICGNVDVCPKSGKLVSLQSGFARLACGDYTASENSIAFGRRIVFPRYTHSQMMIVVMFIESPYIRMLLSIGCRLREDGNRSRRPATSNP